MKPVKSESVLPTLQNVFGQWWVKMSLVQSCLKEEQSVQQTDSDLLCMAFNMSLLKSILPRMHIHEDVSKAQEDHKGLHSNDLNKRPMKQNFQVTQRKHKENVF